MSAHGESTPGPDGNAARSAVGRPRVPTSARYLGGLLVVGMASGAASLMAGRFELSDLTMVYLLGVVVTAVAFGRGPAIVAALASVAAFNYGFVPPRFTFQVAEAKYLVTFAVMFVVAIVTGTLTARLREQLDAARSRERRTDAVYRLSHELASQPTPAEILSTAADRIADALGVTAAIVTFESGHEARLAAGDPALLASESDRAVARRVFETGEPAGTERWSEPGSVLSIPLDAGTRRHGVLRARPDAGAWNGERFQLFRILGGQTSLALERARFAAEAIEARAQADLERTRSVLLSSVSHDLRTPLAAITGAATSLRDGSSRIAESTRLELAVMIAEEAQRLNRLIGNLLEMTRLESGALTVRREWHSLEEVVGAALATLEGVLGDRVVRVDFPADLPLVSLDDVLFESVISNLVENANKYTPPSAAIDLRARVESGELRIEVVDHGPGIPESERERVFEKFRRGAHSGTSRGAGLGLAISRGIVEAHGGTLVATNAADGGACLTITLPLSGSPPVIEGESPLPSAS